MHNSHLPWWKTATCYQIWPASYKDSNGDGTGDIPGVISTLDYVQDLGVDMIWLSPMYDSPQHDMGYDISNYEDVWSKYGNLADMDSLIHEIHARGMQLILDLVVNHTSDEHLWFQESRKSRDNPYSDWYIWRDPVYTDGVRQPPNNWRAAFGGSAWEYAEERDQYYLHLFTSRQPDLNWETIVTRQAIYQSAIKFWLDKGIDGFRVDTVNLYSKDLDFPNAVVTNPGQKFQDAEKFYVNGPRMHEWLREQRREVLDKYGDVFLVGELPGTGSSEVVKYVSSSSRELDCVFDFGICELGGRYGRQPHETWQHTLPELKAALRKTQDLLQYPEAWTTVFAENHDQPRSISTFGSSDPQYQVQSGRLLAILLATLSGTLFVFQGQEIGMTNHPTDAGLDHFSDICGIDYLARIRDECPNDPELHERARQALCRVGRDNARTPVAWNAKGPHAGFTTGSCEPWTKINPNFAQINVDQALQDPNSIFAMWKEMLLLRKKHVDVLVNGDFEIIDADNEMTFTYVKRGQRGMDQNDVVLVALNFSGDRQVVNVPRQFVGEEVECHLLATNKIECQIEKSLKGVQCLELNPWEGSVFRIISKA